ncbi:MAG: peptide-methionine (S)-S-oxide reductase MsrA [Tenacibaculum sp.]
MAKQLATLGGGCFWCTEAIFEEIKGVEQVISGYSGGTAPGRPTYKEVCSGLTGHAEVIQINFDDRLILYSDIIKIFMTSHDPTTLNQQGADIGTQYRSVIFYHNEEQKHTAEKVVNELKPLYTKPIVTQIVEATTFYKAESYHQNYYKQNKNQTYCNLVITPKLQKFRKMHAKKLKN